MEQKLTHHPGSQGGRPLIRWEVGLILVFIAAFGLPLQPVLITGWWVIGVIIVGYLVSEPVVRCLAKTNKSVRSALFIFLLITPLIFHPIPRIKEGAEWHHPAPFAGSMSLEKGMGKSLVSDGQDGLWFGYNESTGGLGHFHQGANGEEHWHIYLTPASNDSPGDGYILSLLPDGPQGLWIGSLHGGVSYLDSQSATLQTLPDFNGDVLVMLADDNGLWVGTFGEGVKYFDLESGSWTTYTQASTNGGLQDDNVTELITDGNGGLWAGTYHGGVSHYNSGHDVWRAYTVASTGGGLGSNDVRTLVVDESGELWVGTFGGGISRYNPLENAWILYSSQTTGGGLVSDYVLALLPDRNGGLWAGMSNLDDEGGLGYFDGDGWYSFTSESTENGLLSNDVRMLATDGVGGVWVGTRQGGLSHLSAGRKTWTNFTTNPDDGAHLTSDSILTLIADNGGVWVGVENGFDFVRWVGP